MEERVRGEGVGNQTRIRTKQETIMPIAWDRDETPMKQEALSQQSDCK